MKNIIPLIALASVLSGCYMAQDDDALIEKAKPQIRAAILEEYEMEGDIVLNNVRKSTSEADDLLGTLCGSFTDSGSGDQSPTRFIYMAIDGDTVLEVIADDIQGEVTAEMMKDIKDANKLFEELWEDGCD